MLTKFQIAFCVLAGLGIVVFGVGMIAVEKQQAQPQNANVAKVPSWLAPVAWGSFGLIVASCVGVVVTLALDREKESGSDDDEEEAELLPVDEPAAEGDGAGGDVPEGDETAPDLTTVESTETEIADTAEPAAPEFSEPGHEETVEFSTLPHDE